MRHAVLAAVAALAPACASSPIDDETVDPDPSPDPDDDDDDDDIDDPTPATLPHCTGRAFTAPPLAEWQHSVASPLVTAAGDPRHFAQDVIAQPGEVATVTAKIAYGAVWKDLEDEPVRAYVDDCDRWVELGDVVTDDDGHAFIDVDLDLSPGQHELRVVVLGDGTQLSTSIWVLPAGTHIVVSDIDGTLTTSDGELFDQLLDGSHVPEAYPGGVELTEAHVGRGHVVVYLTGRPYWLLGITRAWLDQLGYAPGPVHVTGSNTDILPTEGSVGDYKLDWLVGLEARGYSIDLAYGNATTDIYAYLGLGLDGDEVWIIGEHAGAQGTIAVDATWSPRAAEVAAGPMVDQPF